MVSASAAAFLSSGSNTVPLIRIVGTPIFPVFAIRLQDRLHTFLRSVWPNVSGISIPKRVKSAIEQNDSDSEVLVIFIQMSVFSIWFFAWLAAPQPNPETVSSVPLVLSIYLIVAVIRLFAARKKAPSSIYIYLTIAMDYVTYLTSNTVLIGAEISKIMSILIFTIVLAVVVRRAQFFLISSVTEEAAARDLSRFMATPAALQIRSANRQIEAGEGVRRDAAIVNVDIRGFSQMVMNMDGDDAMKLLSDYQHQIVPIVHRHNGVIDKFMGDGIMVTFGVLENDANYCANALKFMDDVLREQPKWQGPARNLNINMAAAEGPVVFGAVGDGDRLELTVIGASVNRSAKMEKHNKVLGTKALAGENVVNKAVAQSYDLTSDVKIISTTIGDDTVPSNIMIIA